MESAIFAEISMHAEDLRHDFETTGTNIHFLETRTVSFL